MVFLLIAILLLGILVAILSIFRPGKADDLPIEKPQQEIVCCGAHEVCEKDSLMAAASEKIEYFDDEELDAFRGISAEQYTDDQTKAFREVFETLPEAEVAAWVRSLRLRCIELPNELKDEVLLIVGERRMKR